MATKIIYVVRDTASGCDLLDFAAIHAGDALARLASIVIGTQRISFELYEIGEMIYTPESTIQVTAVPRKYVCSANQAMLDSHFEDAAELLDPSEENPNGNATNSLSEEPRI